MLQPLFDFIEKLSTDFTWKRLVILISLVMLIGVALFLYEAQTAITQLSKYERTVAIVEKLSALKPENEEGKVVINNIYAGLSVITNPVSNPVAFSTNISIELKQAFLAATPWLLICLFFIPGYFKEKKDAASVVGGTIALALIMGMGGYFIPVELGSWVGFGMYPVGANLFIFILLMWYGNRNKA
jgi:hypothetical protein